MRSLSITVTEAMAGRKVKSILRREFGMPESLIARVKLREKGFTLNGRRCRTIDTVAAGDILCAEIGDEPKDSGIVPMDCPLDILYEDEDIIVINKPAGMASHGASRRGEPTVMNALAHYLGADARFHPVSRLDKGTSGIMLIAKSGYVHDRLRRVLHSEAYRREYLLVTSAVPSVAKGRIDAPISRDELSPIKRKTDPNGAPSVTDYEVLSVHDGLALVRALLHTGRTHQIRVHFASIGCPLVGDWLYGEAHGRISRPALHSAYLELTQPVTGEKIALGCPLPSDIASLGKTFAEAAQKAF